MSESNEIRRKDYTFIKYTIIKQKIRYSNKQFFYIKLLHFIMQISCKCGSKNLKIGWDLDCDYN